MKPSNKTVSSLKACTEEVVRFRDERDWKQFHTSKDMLLSLYLEVAELGEHLQWKTEAEFGDWIKNNRAVFGEELADIFYWVLLIAHDTGVDLETAFDNKMKRNRKKYPVDEARGKKLKYTHYSKK